MAIAKLVHHPQYGMKYDTIMSMAKAIFPKFKWGENTEVQFEPFSEAPKDVPVTSCMVIAVHNKSHVVISRPERGWGLPGGHVEKDEAPQDAVIRELREEAAVSIDLSTLRVVGGWHPRRFIKLKPTVNTQTTHTSCCLLPR